MKQLGNYVVKALIGGAIVVVPIYLAILVLLKAAGSLLNVVRPIAAMLPEWMPAENVLSLLLLVLICFLVGVVVRTRTGKATRERIEKALFERIPGYALFRSLTQRMTNQSEENVWKPDPDELRRLVTDRTRLVFINHPNNPTGSVLSNGDMNAIVAVATFTKTKPFDSATAAVWSG